VGRTRREERVKPVGVVFPCGELKLEGLYFDAGLKDAVPAVVVCHPHSLHGGSMDNNVTRAIAGSLTGAGINAFLFNFRGVGASGGRYGGGIEERKDVLAALDWLQVRQGVDASRLGLAGYSFGAGVAFPVACSEDRVRGVALVSPYFEVAPGSLFETCLKPKLFVTGTCDRIVSPEDVAGYIASALEPKKAVFINGPDHFWAGYESEMSAVADFFNELFE
jgi:uncharacterized protein